MDCLGLMWLFMDNGGLEQSHQATANDWPLTSASIPPFMSEKTSLAFTVSCVCMPLALRTLRILAAETQSVSM